jgi:hypothetical protein
MPAERETWTLVFQALPSWEPAPVRIRRLLKTAVRRDRLRCLCLDECREVEQLKKKVAALEARLQATLEAHAALWEQVGEEVTRRQEAVQTRALEAEYLDGQAGAEE